MIVIINPALLTVKEKGKKLIKVYWDGIKLAIKFVDADATKIKISDKFIIIKSSNFPIISDGLVRI